MCIAKILSRMILQGNYYILVRNFITSKKLGNLLKTKIRLSWWYYFIIVFKYYSRQCYYSFILTFRYRLSINIILNSGRSKVSTVYSIMYPYIFHFFFQKLFLVHLTFLWFWRLFKRNNSEMFYSKMYGLIHVTSAIIFP